ncbi:hypothetical protein J2T21_002505 [Paeniglutamicibacter psychrophenolicus]|nr:hypothetical protein [Paeniglutamicibacter psychrophenolicus]
MTLAVATAAWTSTTSGPAQAPTGGRCCFAPA